MRLRVLWPAVFALLAAFASTPSSGQQPVTTDCEPCQSIAQAVNDQIAQARLAAQQLEEAEAALREVEGRIAAHEAERTAKENEHTAKVTERDQKRAAGDTAGADAADAAQRAAFDRVIEIKNDLDFRLEPERDAAQARVSASVDEVVRQIRRMKELYAELAECEKQCAGADEGEGAGMPMAPGGGTSAPVPVPANPPGSVGTTCEPCRQIASEHSDVLRELTAKGDEQRAVSAAIAELEAEIRSAEFDERDALYQFRLQLSISTDGRESAESRKAAPAKADAAFAEAEKARAVIDRLTPELAQARQRLETLYAEVGELVNVEAELRDALADCELQCAGAGEDEQPGVAPPADGDDEEPPPLNGGSVTTDCPACEVLASLVNDAIGTFRNAVRDLHKARSDLEQAERDNDAARDAVNDARQDLEDLVLEGEALRAAANPDAAAIAANAAAKSAASRRLAKAEEARSMLPSVPALRARVAALDARTMELYDIWGELQRQLVECEKKNCPPDTGQPGVALPEDGDEPPPQVGGGVTTDCPACETLASLVNDAIGTFRNAVRDLHKARTDLEQAERDNDAAEDAVDGARQDLEDLVLEGEALRGAANPDAGAIAANDAEKSAASKKLFDAMDARAGLPSVVELRVRVSVLETRANELYDLWGELQQQLVDCEKKNCPPEGEGGGVALPEEEEETPQVGGGVTTDCPACEALASLVNDAIGTFRNAVRELNEAQSELEQAERDREVADTAAEDALRELERLVLEGEALRGAANPDAGAIAANDAAKSAALRKFTDAEDAQGEIPSLAGLRARVAALDARANELYDIWGELQRQLVECEKKNCPPEGEGGGVALPEEEDTAALPGSGVITTDCPACEDEAAALNETAQRLRNASAALDEARGAYDDIRRARDRAADDADAALEEGGRHAVAAALARDAGDQAAADEAVAKQEEAFTRAANQADAADDLGLQLEAAEAASAAAQAAYDEVNAEFDAAVKALEECEKSCVLEEEALATPDFGIELVQKEDECPAAGPCTVIVTLTSETDDSYGGPVFLSPDFRPIEPGTFGGWYCGISSKQSSLCYTDAENLEQGGTLTLEVPFTPTDGEVCVAVSIPGYGDYTSVSAAIQLGLSGAGFDLGVIDGRIGPKSLAAIDAYLASEPAPDGFPGIPDEEIVPLLTSDDPDEVLAAQAALFNRFFGRQPDDLEDYDEMLDCLDLRLRRELMVRPAEDDDDGPVLLDDEDDDDRPGPRIGIEFDFDREEHEEEHEEEGEDGGFDFPGFKPLGGGGGGVTLGF